MKVRIFAVFTIIVFYQCLKQSDYFLKEMGSILSELKGVPLMQTGYTVGKFLGATFYFICYVVMLMFMLDLIIDVLKNWE